MRSPHDAGRPATETHAEPFLMMLQCMLYQVLTEPPRNEKAVSFMVGGCSKHRTHVFPLSQILFLTVYSAAACMLQ